MKKLLITLLCIGSLYSQESEMKTVDYVEIERFMGKWFVTAIVPNMIENGATNAPLISAPGARPAQFEFTRMPESKNEANKPKPYAVHRRRRCCTTSACANSRGAKTKRTR